MAFIFGYIHIFNYELITNVLLFSPILIGPQIFMGFYLGYIRIKFGLVYSICLHAMYNFILVTPFLIGLKYGFIQS